ncbi:MAG TPA: universal stress protein [Solirubrobacterales bacterium]
MTGGSGPNRPVLVAYDGSEFAKAAIAEVAAQVGTGRPVLVTTVSEPLEGIPFISAAGVPIDPDSMQRVLSAAREGAARTAAEGCRIAADAGLEAEPRVVIGGPIWERIAAAAEEADASLVVIGSRGLSGLKHALLGSVAAAVVQHSRRSVLVVHGHTE